MINYRFILKHASNYKLLFLASFLLIVIVGFINMAHQYVYGLMIDILYYDDNINDFLSILVIFVLVFFLGQLMHYIINMAWLSFNVGFLFDIRSELFDNILNGSEAELNKTVNDDIMKRINVDVNSVLDLVFTNGFYMIANVIKLIIGIGIVFYLNVQIGIICVSMIPLITIINNYLQSKVKKCQMMFLSSESKVSTFAYEFVTKIQTVRLFSALKFMHNKFAAIVDDYNKQIENFQKLEFYQVNITDILLDITNIIIMLASSYFIVSGFFSIGKMISCIAYFTTCKSLFRGLYNRFFIIRKDLETINRVMEILAITPERNSTSKSLEIDSPIRTIDCENVSFKYTTEYVIRNFDANIITGQNFNLKGDNGKGKTTLVKLLLGLYDVSEGSIRFNSRDIRECNLSQIRSKIGVVWQEPLIFIDSIKNNILLDKVYNEEKFKFVLELAGLLPIINQLDRGSDTIIGLPENNLSGGQRQRVMLARTLYSDPEVIIFDESTASLDKKSEDTIISGIYSYLASDDKTVVWISHHRDVIENTDDIYV